MKTKQVIVVRKDLNMRKGKMCAQAAHASMKVIIDMFNVELINDTAAVYRKVFRTHDPVHQWLAGIFTKVVVGCNSEEELLALQSSARMKHIPNAIIQDAGRTEFHNVPTYTALAIGPDDIDKIDQITGHLKLL